MERNFRWSAWSRVRPSQFKAHPHSEMNRRQQTSTIPHANRSQQRGIWINRLNARASVGRGACVTARACPVYLAVGKDARSFLHHHGPRTRRRRRRHGEAIPNLPLLGKCSIFASPIRLCCAERPGVVIIVLVEILAEVNDVIPLATSFRFVPAIAMHVESVYDMMDRDLRTRE